MAGRRKVWITRAEPGAAATAERVRALGFEPVVAPLLTLSPIPDVAIELDGVSALAFTSANGVKAFAERCTERGLKVFAVGEATARAALDWRFKTVLSTNGDVKALAAGIASRRREVTGVVLNPGAAEPAGDLKGALAKQGIELRALPLYKSVPAEIPQEIVALLPGLFGVLLHSPKAASALARLIRRHPAPQLKAWCLSKAVVRPLLKSDLAEVVSASAPNEDALLALLR